MRHVVFCLFFLGRAINEINEVRQAISPRDRVIRRDEIRHIGICAEISELFSYIVWPSTYSMSQGILVNFGPLFREQISSTADIGHTCCCRAMKFGSFGVWPINTYSPKFGAVRFEFECQLVIHYIGYTVLFINFQVPFTPLTLAVT